jgi:hypothetical protein
VIPAKINGSDAVALSERVVPTTLGFLPDHWSIENELEPLKHFYAPWNSSRASDIQPQLPFNRRIWFSDSIRQGGRSTLGFMPSEYKLQVAGPAGSSSTRCPSGQTKPERRGVLRLSWQFRWEHAEPALWRSHGQELPITILRSMTAVIFRGARHLFV